MNQIAWLEKNIAEVEQLLVADREAVQNNPESFSAKLSLKSTENRLADLQKQLQLEKDKREKEVIDFRLTGSQVDRGTIPLDVLSKLAQTISESIHSIAYRMQKGKDPHSAIPRKLQKILDLRLAGLEFGSTRLLITGETRPNLYGQSLAEDSIDAVFKVMNSKTEDEMAEAVANAGLRASRSISRMCNVLLKYNAQVEMTWGAPSGEDRVFKGSSSDLQQLSLSLDDLADIPTETLNVEGTLAMSSIRGQFEIVTETAKYKGKYPDNLLAKVKSVPLGSRVQAQIEKETIENKTTGYAKEVFRLVDIEGCQSAAEPCLS